MSALTKVFVVLLVVISLLFVSGVVVFVNKVEDFGATAREAQKQRDLEKAARTALQTKLIEVQGETGKQIQEATDRASVLLAANQQLQSKVNDLQTEIAKREGELGEIRTQLTTATNAMNVAQQNNKDLDKISNDLRTQIDDLDKKYTQSQVALSDLNNRLDAANLEVRYSKEQIAALETELRAAREKLAQGGTPARPPAPGAPGTAAPAPGQSSAVPPAPSGSAGPVRGVVRNTFNVGDVKYATVGLGSADGVAKGTRFNVVDPTGRTFLGYLTVDTVEPNESSGHLSGPQVPAIQKNCPVMTSWQ